ncbi:hypothetical protein ACFSC4_22435 [Deinococcus malanensis]|uniref:hypothetical protein n=1 Tax=Deinococcus malanensis TaxID=1706855 RepID=UPI001668BCEE|nr:hypothetical protein [Deinococcus malanensis]
MTLPLTDVRQLVETCVSADLAPWPLLPTGMQPTAGALAAGLLSWEVGDVLRADYEPVHPKDPLTPSQWPDLSGKRVAAWVRELEERAAGTSHYLRVIKRGANVDTVYLKRGVSRPPAARAPVAERLTFVYGPATSQHAQLVLALAYGAASGGRSVLLPSPELVGHAALALAGPCELLPADPQDALIALEGMNVGPLDTLTLHHFGDDWNELLLAAYDRGMRLILTSLRPNTLEAESSLVDAGLRCPGRYYGVDGQGNIVREHVLTYREGYSLAVSHAVLDDEDLVHPMDLPNPDLAVQ